MNRKRVLDQITAEWHKNVAIMKTRGFWLVNVFWFVAGAVFLNCLPGPEQSDDAINYLLNELLIVVIVTPIYFMELLTLSRIVNRGIDCFNKWRNAKRP